MVENFRESALEVCVKPFNPRTRVDLKLKVVNLGSARDVTVGGVSLRKNQLTEGTEHIISASHFVEEGEVIYIFPPNLSNFLVHSIDLRINLLVF